MSGWTRWFFGTARPVAVASAPVVPDDDDYEQLEEDLDVIRRGVKLMETQCAALLRKVKDLRQDGLYTQSEPFFKEYKTVSGDLGRFHLVVLNVDRCLHQLNCQRMNKAAAGAMRMVGREMSKGATTIVVEDVTKTHEELRALAGQVTAMTKELARPVVRQPVYDNAALGAELRQLDADAGRAPPPLPPVRRKAAAAPRHPVASTGETLLA